MSSVNLQSLDDLRMTLIRRGIPAHYAQRVTAELTDHTDDLAAADDNSDRCLGDLTQLADQVTQSFRQRTFTGRHPWLTLVLLPLPLTVFAYSALMYGFVSLAGWFCRESLLDNWQVGETWIAYLALAVPVLGFPGSCAIVIGLISRCTRRAGFTWKRTVLTCLPVLLLGLHISTNFRSAPKGESHSQFLVGIGIPILETEFPFYGIQQVLHVLFPLLVLAGMMVHEAHKQRWSLEIVPAE